MPNWLNTLLDFAAQVTGGRSLEQPEIISHFIIATFGWFVLLRVAISKQRQERSPRERLLIWAFSLGLVRELLMIFVKVIGGLGVIDPERLHVFFPPAEHLLQSISMVVAAAAFILYTTQDDNHARAYLKVGIAAMVACYFATFWWWADFITESPECKFGHVWCDNLFHSILSLLLVYAVVFLARHCHGWLRFPVCSAFVLCLINVFLKIPDNLTDETYKGIYGPIRHGAYLLAIPLLGYVYLREQLREMEDHRSALAISEDRLSMAFRATNDALWDCDFSNHQLFVNDAYIARFGQPTFKSDGHETWHSKVHPDERGGIAASFQEGLASSDSWEGHYRCKKLDGTYASVIDRCRLTRDASGKVVRALGAMTDVTEVKTLQKRIIGISEEEQRRIGNDIHDDLCQRLFGLDCQIQSLQQQLAHKVESSAETTMSSIKEGISEANARARAMALGLSPVMIHTNNLKDTFVQLVQQTESAYSVGCQLTVSLMQMKTPEDPDVGTQLVRVTQEALRNAVHHGKATQIDLQLTETEGHLDLIISDNGEGFIPENRETSKGLGMQSMQYRISHLNGSWSIDSEPGNGTTVHCRIPIKQS